MREVGPPSARINILYFCLCYNVNVTLHTIITLLIMKKIFITLLLALGIAAVLLYFYTPVISTNIINQENTTQRAFKNIGLQTNTSISDIPLNEVLGGGPRKDGIPSLTNPLYTSIENATNIPDESLGVLVQGDAEEKFYPYTVLVWHEIVNDTIDNVPVSVTFCPLCGSAIAFERTQGDTVHEFGVSGKLWQSNLLMYDKATESLWSQIEGRAVVGDLTGATLDIYPSQLITWSEAKNTYPDLQVLSEKTGHIRDYGFYPYGDYEDREDLIFPINNPDATLPAKTLMYASIINNEPVAFHRENLLKQKTATLETGSRAITATASDNNEITLTDESGVTYPGYVTMWFSWANHNEGVVWEG